MGRKPNPLIVEFFERGEKLEDASNRYRQTCRACHQEFPKGRNDALVAHIIRCIALSPHDHQRVVDELGSRPAQQAQINGLSSESQEAQISRQSIDGANLFADVGLVDQVAGLNDTGNLDNPRKRKRGAGGQVNLDQKQYEVTFQVQTPVRPARPTPKAEEPEIADFADTNQVDEDRMRENLQSFTEIPRDTIHEGYQSAAGAPENGLTSGQLALAASVANDLIPQEIDAVRSPMGLSTTQAGLTQSGNAAFHAIDPLLGGDEEVLPRRRAASPRKPPQDLVFHHIRPGADPDAPHAPYLQNFSIYADGERINGRTRTKFTEDRRREVQEVRKQGACIRCRMLKKPCSEETPCSTCRHIDSARLWRAPCMRARIADEFDLLRDNVHLLIVMSELKLVDNVSLPEPLDSGVVETTHFPNDEESDPARFSSTRRRAYVALSKDDAAPLTATQPGEPAMDVETLSYDSGSIGNSLASYLRASDRLYCERESSPFMRETLLMAYELLDEKEDALLRSAISLWSSTTILTSPHWAWHIKLISRDRDSASEEVTDDVSSAEITAENDPLSHRLITGQLREATEKQASTLCRIVMQDFEKRLIQRQRVHQQQFETFLAAVILLNCIEKLCWLFNTWVMQDQELLDRTQDEADGVDLRPPIATNRGVWPSPKSPGDFVKKGETVADIIAMLMKMRDLPPPMAVDEDKYLVADLTKKPPKGARYDASGYKGAPSARNEKRSKVLTDLDTLFGNTTLGNRPRSGLQMDDEKGQEEQQDLDLPVQEPMDEHQRALIAQLHLDLQAKGLFQKPREPAQPDGLNKSSLNDGAIVPELESSFTAPDQDGAPQGLDRVQQSTTDDDIEDVQMTTTPVPEDNNAPHDGKHEEAYNGVGEQEEQARSPPEQAPLSLLDSLSEDPLMAHLRQAAAEAAKGVQTDEFDDDVEMQQADMNDADDKLPRTPPVEIWFDRIKLKVEDVIRARKHPPWDDQDPRCWELKFISRMLLPDMSNY